MLAVGDEQVHSVVLGALLGPQAIDERERGANGGACRAGIDGAGAEVPGVVQKREKQVKEELAVGVAADVAA